MSTIKIFLASSKELELERDKFASLINQLNRIFKRRGLELELVIWEYLDSSMSKKRKQDEYNEELRQCEICLVVFWNVFGDYTKEEFNIAYDGLCAGNNPKRLYVFFKEPAKMSDDMLNFKNSFADKYGHFYSVFDNADTLKLNFLLQLEIFKNDVLDISKSVSVEDSCVSVGGVPFIDLRNVPFAANNESYITLQQQIDKQRKRVNRYPDDLEEQSELHILLEKRQEVEDNMVNLARKLAEQSTHKMSPRMIEARRLFELGELQAVIKILDTKDIIADIKSSKSTIEMYNLLREQEMANIEQRANEIQLRIRTEKVLSEIGWTEKIIKEYKCLIDEIRGYVSPICFARILFEAARFIEDYCPDILAANYYTECIDTMKSLKTIPDSEMPVYADMLFYAGKFFTEDIFEIDYDPTEGEWMGDAEIKIHNKVVKRWNRYKKLAKHYLESSVVIFNKINHRNNYAEDIYYSLACLARYESLHRDDCSVTASNKRLLQYTKSTGLSNELILSAFRQSAVEFYINEDIDGYNQIIIECDRIIQTLNIQSLSTSSLSDLATIYEMKKDYQQAMVFSNQALEKFRELSIEDPYAYQDSIASCLESIAICKHWLNTDYKTNPETKQLLDEAEQIYNKLYDVTGSNVYWRKRGHILNLKFELRLKERMDYCSHLFKSIQDELIQYFSTHLKSGKHTYNIDWGLDCPIKNISAIIRKIRNKDLYKLSFTWEFDPCQTTGYEYINMDIREEFSKSELYTYLSSRECYDDLCAYIIRGIDKGGHMD